MKSRIFLLLFFVVAVLYFTTDYLVISHSKTQTGNIAANLTTTASSFYRYIYRADSLYEIRAAEDLAKKPELLQVFDNGKWEEIISDNPQDVSLAIGGENEEVLKEISMKVQVELNVINRMYDKNDAVFVIDRYGNVVAKNLDGLFGHQNLSDEVLFSAALAGVSDIDIVRIADRTYRVVATPMYKDGEIIGAYCSADLINSETAIDISSRINEAPLSVMEGGRVYFAFFDKKRLIGSTLPTELHEGFRDFISESTKLFETIEKEGTQKYHIELNIRGSQFYANIAKHPALSETNDFFYITMISADKVLAPVRMAHRSLLIITFLLLVIAIIATLVLDEYLSRPVNRFMENMLEIINGNMKYRFDNDAEGIEGSLNQNANMMIASLLGEKIPEKDIGDENN